MRPRARHRAGRLRLHAAHRRRPAARQLPARARGAARLRRVARPDRRVSPPAARYKSDDELRAFWNRLADRVRACRASRRRASPATFRSRRRLQRQRHPRRGLRDGARRVADLSVQRVGRRPATSSRWASRSSAAGSSPPRTTSRRRRSSSSTNGSPAASGRDSDPIGRRMWKPESAEDLTRARTEDPLLHGRGRRRQHPMTGLTEKEPVGAYYFPFAQHVGRVMTLAVPHRGRSRRRSPAAPRSRSRRSIRSFRSSRGKPMQQRVESRW